MSDQSTLLLEHHLKELNAHLPEGVWQAWCALSHCPIPTCLRSPPARRIRPQDFGPGTGHLCRRSYHEVRPPSRQARAAPAARSWRAA